MKGIAEWSYAYNAKTKFYYLLSKAICSQRADGSERGVMFYLTPSLSKHHSHAAHLLFRRCVKQLTILCMPSHDYMTRDSLRCIFTCKSVARNVYALQQSLQILSFNSFQGNCRTGMEHVLHVVIQTSA
ncbi:uncharacterized protein PHALS_14598 [Plasmopara halstedii]|uniref:Uncharacterized protein n=1 Tax=Plasmopara halstedii TaxID=4781 RepID=A0A0P1ALG0_PLAHL|nr:uncharacterized protein PHALS_14598 [Plasmopara halstedii]CEG42150.1 hypothetical protein PHALS_14598 [Plasmopara halstedii]|eukprot:XP_024578519.1 hypothetical protein PHALS_14598 [Plasmopara halstedii]